LIKLHYKMKIIYRLIILKVKPSKLTKQKSKTTLKLKALPTTNTTLNQDLAITRKKAIQNLPIN